MIYRRSPFSRQVFEQKDLPLRGIVMFGRYQFAASFQPLPSHSHPDAIEICFLERGEQTYRIGERLYRLRGNDQFFTLPGELHDSAALPQERGVLYWVILRLDIEKDFLGLSGPMASRLKRELRRMPVRHFRAHPDCARILGQMIDLLSEKQPAPRMPHPAYRQIRLQSLLLQYLTLTLEASHRNARDTASPLMRRVLQYVEEHLHDPVHVPRLAEVAGLSESRFKIRFKKEIGVPPAEYWVRQKIERAALLLKKKNVTEVAYELGFSSSQYFATVFKRYTLANPSCFHPHGH